MQISKVEFTNYIKEFKFKELFNYFGWNNDRTPVHVDVDGYTYTLTSVAEKNGFRVLICTPNETGSIPKDAERKKIDTKVTKLFQEHLTIFCNGNKTEQVWQFIQRQSGKPNKVAEIKYNISQSTEKLYQRASGLFFSIVDEDNITIIDVTNRVTSNFGTNSEKITKKFYDGFKKQHTSFISFIKGIDGQLNKEWYASLMLNRLMFCYFIQKRGFLDNNKDYLRSKLNQCQQKYGKGKFYSFYRNFLLELFHQGLNTYKHSDELINEIGQVPYLNGGLFDVHEIEQNFPEINISDEAFGEIFKFFDQYDWHLDTGESASGNEINPDVLGYIFEKYINDKAQMGSYYTKEDITGYISRNCIIPFLFEETKRKYPKAFEEGGQIWQMLIESGDKYIFEAVKKGVNLDLPHEIKIGIDTSVSNLLERRKDWNICADEEYALPTEIWREVVERRQRYNEIKSAIECGNITNINDFITYNLNIRQFMQDIVQYIDDPDFIGYLYKILKEVTILDPTCGSGAFLFAALNILEPLYEGCINRMESYVEEGIEKKRLQRDFENELEIINSSIHPNKEYYIYKCIILNNLYGVDIMKEAVETAKLRLFLKLVSTVDPVYSKDNLGLEPLPDVDFNIKAGNTLVGYATEEELDDALFENFDGFFAKAEIKEISSDLSKAYARYKKIQLEYKDDYEEFKRAKEELLGRQNQLNNRLNKLMFENYGGKFEKWLDEYQPFHWFAEFYEIIEMNGGFDVIIGNPPYVEYSVARKKYTINNYKTLTCGNLYAFVLERSIYLQKNGTYNGMIIPLSAYCTDRMKNLHSVEFDNCSHMYLSNYAERPSKLFDGAERNLTICILKKDTNCKLQKIFSTYYYKWNANYRSQLFSNISYTESKSAHIEGIMPKLSSIEEVNIIKKLRLVKKCIGFYTIKTKNSNILFYRNSGGRYWKIITDFQPKFYIEGKRGISSRESYLYFEEKSTLDIVASVLNSSLYYWYYIMHSDARTNNPSDLKGFPIDFQNMNPIIQNKLIDINKRLMSDLQNNSVMQKARYNTGNVEFQQFYPQKSKAIIDEIDKVLAIHYGFTQEELDFIINYDIKYRMGSGMDEDEE